MLWHALNAGWRTWTLNGVMFEDIGRTDKLYSSRTTALHCWNTCDMSAPADGGTVALFYRFVLNGFIGAVNDGEQL